MAVETVTIDVLLNGKKAEKGVKNLTKQFKSLEKIGKKTSGFFNQFLKFAGVAAFAKMAIDATQLSRSIELLSDRTGIATSKLMGMRTAFSAMGGDAKAMDRTLGGISKGLAGLSMGDGETAAKLASMNISAWDESGQVKSADVVWGDIAEWTKAQLAAGRTNEEVATYLEKAFGTTYEQFKALSLGREGLAQREAELNAQTGVADERQAKNLNNLYLTFSKLTTTVEVLVQKIMGDIAPAIEFVANLLQYFFKELQEVFSDVIDVIGEVFGTTDELNDAFDALKKVVWFIAKLFQAFGYWVAGVLKVFRVLGEWIGKLIAFLQDKLGWFFSSPREKELQRDKELSRKAMENPELDTTEKRLKWMSEQGSPYWKEQYDKFLEERDLGNVQVVWADQLDGSEVMKAEQGAGDTFVDVSVNNDWIENPDGTYTIMTDVDVNSSDGNSFTTSINKALNGGHV